MSILSFEIHGKLALWREPYIGKSRVSLLYPSITQIIGILGAIMGYERKETYKKLQNKLKIGIKLLSLSGFLEESVQLWKYYKGKKWERTVESFRVLVDPVYRIYVYSEDKLIKELSNKIESPEYPIYLGISEYIADIRNIEVFDKVNKEKTREIVGLVEWSDKFDYEILDKTKPSIAPRFVYITKKWEINKKWKPKISICIESYNVKLKLPKEIEVYSINDDKVFLF